MTSLNYVEPPNSNLVRFYLYNYWLCVDPHLDLLYLPVSAVCLAFQSLNLKFVTNVDPALRLRTQPPPGHACIPSVVTAWWKQSDTHHIVPIDRSALSMEDLTSANPIVKHLVDELIVECPMRTSGCPHTCQRQLLESHMKDACQYVTVPCSEEDCDQMVLIKDRGKHADVCVHRSIDCDGCGVSVRHSDLTDHHSECASKHATCVNCSSEFPRPELQEHVATCPKVVVSCLHAGYGCSWSGTRQALSDLHIPSCSYESIKGFFAIHGARVSTLSVENTALKQRVETLEGILHLMQREMQISRSILGPWHRSEIQRTNRGDARHVPVSDDSNFAGPSLSRNAGQRTQVTTVPDSFEAMGAELDAASFFPPADVVYDNHHGHTHARTPSGLLDIQSHPGQRSLPLTPVAPLNLSTSLEGSFSGLRDSITAVAASVDSLARRNDIALTNENMRINEELGSLKYAVHGIRLQVHRLMMDRNVQVTGRLSESSSSSTLPVPVPAPARPVQPAFYPPIMTPPFPGPPGTKL
ncbi:hypothetical protein JVU11DRAFT_2305 [Chiua virens]|nr:hypothetical protein JVU11DRAFT_2305 [Chiua virens]